MGSKGVTNFLGTLPEKHFSSQQFSKIDPLANDPKLGKSPSQGCQFMAF